MRPLMFLLLLALCYSVTGRGGARALTESMGQEIIEIGPPVKDLPPEMEEEPSAEVDDDYKQLIAAASSSTKKETRKTTTTSQATQASRRSKDIDISDEDDVKVERELADMYKDTNTDYKDTVDAKDNTTTNSSKPIARNRNSFKFQPDINNPREVERFRTSIDEISCDSATSRLNSNSENEKQKAGNGAFRLTANLFLYAVTLMLAYS